MELVLFDKFLKLHIEFEDLNSDEEENVYKELIYFLNGKGAKFYLMEEKEE